MVGERLWWWLHPPSAWLSSIALLQWLPSFPPQEFSTPVSSLTSLQSLPSQQQPSPWDCSTIPKFQLPATVPSRVCMAAARTVWFSFHLGCHRSAVSLSALNVSPLTQTIAPMWGLPLCFSSSTCQGQVQSYWHSYFFPPSSFILPSFAWVYIFFSAGQVLLSALSWCVLTYPWREIYSMSTYSSAILSLPRHTLERLTKGSWSCSINLIPSLTWHKTSLGIHWGIFLDGIHNISDCLTFPFTFPSKSQMNQLLAWNRGP